MKKNVLVSQYLFRDSDFGAIKKPCSLQYMGQISTQSDQRKWPTLHTISTRKAVIYNTSQSAALCELQITSNFKVCLLASALNYANHVLTTA